MQILELSDTTYEIQYLFLFVFLLIGISFIFMCLNFIFGYRTTLQGDKEKLSPYECGFDPYEDARQAFDVRFYLVSMLFIIFDLEAMYLFPWAISLHQTGSMGFWTMIEFLFELGIGFVYAWKIRALEWE